MSDKCVLVPVEPTEEMLTAGARAERGWSVLDTNRSLYRAMLAARPTAPAQDVEALAREVDLYYTKLIAQMTEDIQHGRPKISLMAALSEVTAIISKHCAAPAQDVRCSVCDGSGQDMNDTMTCRACGGAGRVNVSPFHSAVPAQDGFNDGIEAAAKCCDDAASIELDKARRFTNRGMHETSSIVAYHGALLSDQALAIRALKREE
jgi:hypothetical protein